MSVDKSIEICHLAIAKALDCKIFVEARKFRILNQLEDDDLSKRLTTKADETNLHIVGMGSITPPVHFLSLQNYFLLIVIDVANSFG